MARKAIFRSLISSKYIYAIIFVVGVFAFAYPLVSSLINLQTQTQVISNYQREMEQELDEAERQRLQDEAERYNEFVAGLEGNVTDEVTDEEKEAVEVVYMGVLSTGEAIGYVEIPKIDINIPIYRGASDEVLDRGIGHLERSSLPVGGESTHSVLSGHRGLPQARMFRDLGLIEMGDVFFINSLGDTLAYKVESIQVVLPHEVESLRIQEGRDLCTLVTCDPYMINSHRLLVTGYRVDYDPQLIDQEKQKEISFFEKYIEYFIIVAFFLLLALIVWLIRASFRKKNKQEAVKSVDEGGAEDV